MGKSLSKDAHNKLRGGYYTPYEIASWLCDWAIKTPEDNILEPSCGDGVFLECSVNRLMKLGAAPANISSQLFGVELYKEEVEKCYKRIIPPLNNNSFIHCGDFFEWSLSQNGNNFNCVVGNPPFIRYQNFPEPSRTLAMSCMKRQGLAPNRLTNIWVPFVSISTDLLAEGGRLALLIPAELLQVSYAAQLRSFLVNNFKRIEMIACNQMLFSKAEQEVVLLLADEKKSKGEKGNKCFISLWEAKDGEQIKSYSPASNPDPRQYKIVDHNNEKWLKYFLSPYEISLMRRLRNSDSTANLKDHCSVDVGIVTGRNEFFVLGQEEINKRGLDSYCIPLIGRAQQLRGAVINRKEHNRLAKNGHKVFLLHVNGQGDNELGDNLIKYIKYGEQRGFHKGYKCSIRNPWYQVPSVWQPDFFFFRQIYDFPRIVLNKSEAVSTDTIHRMTCNAAPELLMSNYYSHLTAASAEIEGRSYGGGVLELEPTEAERLLIPGKLYEGYTMDEIDSFIREGKLEQLLNENDKNILMDNLGFSKRDCTSLKKIWDKMRDRRQSRRKRKISH